MRKLQFDDYDSPPTAGEGVQVMAFEGVDSMSKPTAKFTVTHNSASATNQE